MGIPPSGRAFCRRAELLDRATAGSRARKCHACAELQPGSDQGAAPAGGTRASWPIVASGQTPWRRGVARERPESALALGILLALRSHLSELATGADAGRRPRLCADSRADASETARSLSTLLAPRRPRVPRLRKRAAVAPRTQIPAPRRLTHPLVDWGIGRWAECCQKVDLRLGDSEKSTLSNPTTFCQSANLQSANSGFTQPSLPAADGRIRTGFQAVGSVRADLRRHERTCNRGREGQGHRGRSRAALP